MAKPAKGQEQEGEITFTMVKFGMKGSDATLQKGMDAIKSAFAQAGFVPGPETRQVRGNGVKHLAAPVDEAEPEVADEVVDAEDVEDAAPIAAPKRTSAPKKPRNFKIMKELTFDETDPTLQVFVTEKKPSTHLDRYLCIAYWFKHTKGVEDLTTEHFFTAYMHYQWSMPGNAATPVADLRHQKRQWFVGGTAPATCTISNAGERRVMEMGKAES